MPQDYWSIPAADLLRTLQTSPSGLTPAEAARRLEQYGRNELRERRALSRFRALSNQLKNPLLLLLVFAAIAGAASREWADAAIVLLIVAVTVGVGYSREYSAHTAAEAMRKRIRTMCTVRRDGRQHQAPADEIVPGDIVLLSAGSLVPADGVILSSSDFFVSEAALTGESFPLEKSGGEILPATPLAQRRNCVFLGTNVRSGTAECVIAVTGAATHYGEIAQRLILRPPETDFERGLRRFGYLLTVAMLVMVLAVFAIHMVGGRPPVETLLFAVALAVGLSPELLPAILSINLSRGAGMMSGHGVLVRRLNAIENLGSIDILCTDKTGTLTEGVVQLEGAFDAAGRPSSEVLHLAAWNAALETGLANPLDDAILRATSPDLGGLEKLAEIPFDFTRRRLSVILRDASGARMITKGAFHHVLEACAPADLQAAQQSFEQWSRQGIRVIAVASRPIETRDSYSRDDERDLHFDGFLTFLDRPKSGVDTAIAGLAKLGVAVKVITGDNRLVTAHLASTVGLNHANILTGADLDALHDEALWRIAEKTDLFVEVDPNQKERIILALKKMGHVVGFLGDGVNDAPAMHAADTSLSVQEAVDVAREAADFVLLERDLDVIRMGITEGRKTFANTLKYILTTTSANLGNMLSMAVASLFLPFLPLLASQILLNNFLSDIPAAGIANDSVDPEMVDRPGGWDMRFIGRFMIEFGLLSSLFDLATFAILLAAFHAGPELFRTGWFVESLLTELVIALVVRTRRPFYQSRPGRLLFVSTLILIAATFAIPYAPFASALGFVPLSGLLFATIAAITAAYLTAAEAAKLWFFRHEARRQVSFSHK